MFLSLSSNRLLDSVGTAATRKATLAVIYIRSQTALSSRHMVEPTHMSLSRGPFLPDYCPNVRSCLLRTERFLDTGPMLEEQVSSVSSNLQPECTSDEAHVHWLDCTPSVYFKLWDL
jgi:hypothetical protein